MIRKPYSKHIRSCIDTGAGLTKQSFKQECDVNHLLKRYQKTGMIEHINHYQGKYDDLHAVPDYHTALNIILSADHAFGTLPSSLRKKFKNDPAEFLTFVSDPENMNEMIQLGLIPQQAASGAEAPASAPETQPPAGEPKTPEGGKKA